MSKVFDIAFKLGAELTSSFGAAFAEAGKSMKGLEKAGESMKSIGKSMTKTVTAPIMGLGAAAVMVGANFEVGMSKVSAVSGATGSDLVALTEKARELGAKTQFSATEAADALNYMAMAGWDTGQMLGGIDGVMSLAAASGEDLAMVSDIVTDSLTAFGMKAEDSGRFADVLAAASSNANTNVSMLGESFKYVAPLAGALGYSAEDTTKALSLMANAGIKGSQSGTALKTMLANLASPTKKMKGSMDALGISLTNSDGTMKTLDEVMVNLRGSFDGLTEVQQASAASTIFGKEAMAGALAVINASEGDYDKLSDAIGDSAGAAEAMAAIVNDNLMGRLKEMRSALEEAGISIYENLKPALEAGVAAITKFADWFNELSPAAQNTAVVIAGVVAAIGPFLVITGTLITSLVTVISAYKATKAAIIALSVVQKVSTAVTRAHQVAMTSYALRGGGVRAAVGAMTDGFRALNLTMLLNPFVLVAVALVALGAAFVIAYKKSEAFRNVVDATFAKVKEVIASAVNYIKTVAPVMWNGLISGLQAMGGRITAASSTMWNGLVDGSRAIGGRISDAIMIGIVGNLVSSVQAIGGRISDAIGIGMVSKVSGLVSGFIGQFKSGLSSMPGILSMAAPMLTTMGLSFLGVSGPIGLVIGAVVSLVGFIYRLSQTNEGVAAAISTAWNMVKDALAPVIEVFSEGFAQFVEEVGPQLEETIQVISESFTELAPVFAEVGASLAELGPALFSAFAEMVPVIMSVGLAVSDVFQTVFPAIVSIVSAVIPIVVQILMSIVPIVLMLVQTVIPLILTVIQTVFPIVLSIISAVIPIILQILMSIIPVILMLVETVIPLILSVIQMVFPIILTIIQTVLPVFATLITTVISVILTLVQTVIPLILTVIQAVLPVVLAVVQAIIPIIATVLQVLVAVINGVVIPAINAILAVVQIVFPYIQMVISNALAIINGIIQVAMALLQGDWSGAWEAIKGTATTIMDNIISFFSSIDLFSVGKAIIDGLINGIKSMGSAVIGAITNMVPAPIRGVVSGLIGSIGGYAKGGIVTAPELAWIGEGGDTESVIPWNNSSRSRDLWFETGNALGMFDADGGSSQEGQGGVGDIDFGGFKSKGDSGGGGGTVVHFKPTYHINGGDPAEVVEAVEKSNDDLRGQLKDIKDDDERRRL